MQNRDIEVPFRQLDRILSFFPRVETKASFLFAVNTSVLGITAINLRPEDFGIWYVALAAGATAALNLTSFFFLYQCSFPSLKGGERSLIYFREIAKLREADFIDSFLKADDAALARDALGQIWRNSEILTAKFDALKIAFILTAVAMLPWALYLVGAGVTHSQLPSLH